MGSMGPRGLGPWALWAPGALGPKLKKNRSKKKLKTLHTSYVVRNS